MPLPGPLIPLQQVTLSSSTRSTHFQSQVQIEVQEAKMQTKFAGKFNPKQPRRHLSTMQHSGTWHQMAFKRFTRFKRFKLLSLNQIGRHFKLQLAGSAEGQAASTDCKAALLAGHVPSSCRIGCHQCLLHLRSPSLSQCCKPRCLPTQRGVPHRQS